MQFLTSLLLAGLAGVAVASPATTPTGPAKTYAKCQRTGKSSPLKDCPKNTIYVAQHDTKASFSKIQDAINSLGNNTKPYTILIAPGDYYEQLNVTRPGPVTLLGVSDRPSKGQLFADVENDTDHANGVRIWFNAANFNATYKDNVYTSVINVGPTLESTLTGSGPTGYPVPAGTPFGCTDFRVYNIDFWNNQYNFSNGPAHAVGVSRANAGFYSCGLYSYQDTVRQYSSRYVRMPSV